MIFGSRVERLRAGKVGDRAHRDRDHLFASAPARAEEIEGPPGASIALVHVGAWAIATQFVGRVATFLATCVFISDFSCGTELIAGYFVPIAGPFLLLQHGTDVGRAAAITAAVFELGGLGMMIGGLLWKRNARLGFAAVPVRGGVEWAVGGTF